MLCRGIKYSVIFALMLNGVAIADPSDDTAKAALMTVYGSIETSRTLLPYHKKICDFRTKWGAQSYSQKYVDFFNTKGRELQRKASDCYQARFGKPITKATYNDWLNTKPGLGFRLQLELMPQDSNIYYIPRNAKEASYCVNYETAGLNYFGSVYDAWNKPGWCDNVKD